MEQGLILQGCGDKAKNKNSPWISLTSTVILLFVTVLNWVLKYLNVSLSTVVMVSSQEDTVAPSERKKQQQQRFETVKRDCRTKNSDSIKSFIRKERTCPSK